MTVHVPKTEPPDPTFGAKVEDRKILSALRLVFGWKLAAMKDVPPEERKRASRELVAARANLMGFRRRHPELVDPPVRQLSLEV